jgi:hypothetical protein
MPDMMEIKPTGEASGEVRQDQSAPEPSPEAQSNQPQPSKLASWFKGLSIPKTLLGLAMIAVGIKYKNQSLIDAGIAIAGVGVTSKMIKAAQGSDPLEHERKVFSLFKVSRHGDAALWDKVRHVAQKRKGN